jgi:endonuclease YncB( thermonuclease family)
VIVELYPHLLLFKRTRTVDADTFVGVATVPVSIFIPVLGLETQGQLPLPVTVRLDGIDAYEKRTDKGKQAIQFVTNWFEQAGDTPLYLGTAGHREKYGRWLGDIRLSPSHYTGLSQALINEGFAWLVDWKSRLDDD